MARAFKVNQDRLMSRWPGFVELFEWSRPAGGAQALVSFTARDWRDLQLLSELAWMEGSWFQRGALVSRQGQTGEDSPGRAKPALRTTELDLWGVAIPPDRVA